MIAEDQEIRRGLLLQLHHGGGGGGANICSLQLHRRLFVLPVGITGRVHARRLLPFLELERQQQQQQQQREPKMGVLGVARRDVPPGVGTNKRRRQPIVFRADAAVVVVQQQYDVGGC